MISMNVFCLAFVVVGLWFRFLRLVFSMIVYRAVDLGKWLLNEPWDGVDLRLRGWIFMVMDVVRGGLKEEQHRRKVTENRLRRCELIFGRIVHLRFIASVNVNRGDSVS